MIQASQLCYGDVLKHSEEGAYVVRAIHQKPIFFTGNPTPTFRLLGFTLFETTTLTDREVTIKEMQTSLDDASLIPFVPTKARRVAMNDLDFPLKRLIPEHNSPLNTPAGP